MSDATGNAYVSGYYNNTISFGSITLSDPDTVGANFFIVKYNPSGSVVWAKSFHDSLGDYTYSQYTMAIDPSGNIFLYGTFISPTITFGTTTLTNAYINNNFLVKLNNAGSVLWAKNERVSLPRAPGNNQAVYVATDPSGNVIVTGFFDSSITIGTTYLANNFSGGLNGYIAKYDPSGNVLWAKCSHGSTAGYNLPTALAVDGSGNIYLGGNFSSTTFTFGTSAITNAGGTDFFLTKFNPAGTSLWAKSITDSCNSEFRRMATDAAGNVYLVGNFNCANITFGATTLNNHLVVGHSSDIFIAKCDNSGNFLWAKSAGGDNSDLGEAVAVDPSGNVFIGGLFASDPAYFGSTTLTNIGMYIAKYNTGGGFLWARSSGVLNGGSSVISVALDPTGNLYATGSNLLSLILDTITLNNTTCPNGAMYIAKFNNQTSIVPVIGHEIEDVSIYPNPATDELFITASGNICKVVIFNLLGQTLLVKDAQSEQLQLDISAIPPGVYFLKANNSIVKQFVKK